MLEIAAVAQAAILPPIPERLGPLQLAASCDSAQEEAEVGGDACAAVLTPFGVRLLLADVRGHGLDAVHVATAVLAEVDGDVVRIVNAGHAPPLLLRDGAATALDPPCPALLLGPGAGAEPLSVRLGRLRTAVDDRVQGRPNDDVTILTVQYAPLTEPLG